MAADSTHTLLSFAFFASFADKKTGQANRREHRRRQQGFTLLELIVAVAIFAVVATIQRRGSKLELASEFVTLTVDKPWLTAQPGSAPVKTRTSSTAQPRTPPLKYLSTISKWKRSRTLCPA